MKYGWLEPEHMLTCSDEKSLLKESAPLFSLSFRGKRSDEKSPCIETALIQTEYDIES